jgi:hypothetical protein
MSGFSGWGALRSAAHHSSCFERAATSVRPRFVAALGQEAVARGWKLEGPIGRDPGRFRFVGKKLGSPDKFWFNSPAGTFMRSLNFGTLVQIAKRDARAETKQ